MGIIDLAFVLIIDGHSGCKRQLLYHTCRNYHKNGKHWNKFASTLLHVSIISHGKDNDHGRGLKKLQYIHKHCVT